MPYNEWPISTIGEICEGIYDGPHATPQKTDVGPIFLGISNLNRGRLHLQTVAHLSEEDFIKWTRRVTPKTDDLVFSYETRLGEAALIPQGLRCCLGRRMGLIRPNLSQVDPRFLLYAYLSPEFQQVIKKYTVYGSTVNRILLTELPDYPIRVPPLSIQRNIANILGSLDDKIKLNRQMNQTLEAIARAIFKSWFVDFDPVWAKMEGRDYPLDAKTLALFPDHFEDSELGEIPADWRIEELQDLGKIVTGKTPSTKIPAHFGGSVPFITPSDMNGQKFVPFTARCLSNSGVSAVRTARIPAGAVMVSCIGSAMGKVAFSTRESVTNQQINSIVFGERVFAEYTFQNLSRRQDELRSLASSGSAIPILNKGHFSRIPILLPPSGILEKFADLVSHLSEKILSNIEEASTLAQLRDTLLTKLISGELRVSKAIGLAG